MNYKKEIAVASALSLHSIIFFTIITFCLTQHNCLVGEYNRKLTSSTNLRLFFFFPFFDFDKTKSIESIIITIGIVVITIITIIIVVVIINIMFMIVVIIIGIIIITIIFIIIIMSSFFRIRYKTIFEQGFTRQ